MKKIINPVRGLFFSLNINDRLFIVGLILLNVFIFINNFQDKFRIPSSLKYACIILALIIFFKKFVSTLHLKNSYNIYSAFIVFVFSIRTFLLLIFSVYFSSIFVQNLFVNQLFFLPYFIPVIILFTHFDIVFFKFLFKLSYFFSIISLVLLSIILISGVKKDLSELELSFIQLLAMASSILFLISHLYRDKKIFWIILLSILLGIVIVSLLGRRGALASSAYLFFFFFVLRFSSKIIINSKKMMYVILIGSLAVLFILSFSFLQANIYVFQRGFSADSWNESRGGVLESFFQDFSSKSEWLFGRGLNGKIMRSVSESNSAAGIENGFLTLILKG